MAGFVDSTVKDIDERLAELRDELDRLEAARSALTGRAAAAPRASNGRRGRGRRAGVPETSGTATATPAPGRRPGRPRGRRGGNTRAKEALDLVRSRPGITIPEIAEQLSILPNYLYRVMPKLVADGQVRRDGQGWHPVG